MYRENLRERISSHKQNLIFEGIDGGEYNKWETEGVIRDFWAKCMAIPENTAYGMTILDCHRLKPREGYPTAIIVKFAQLSDRDFVLNHAKNLKKFRVKTGSQERQQYFAVQEHYPMELREQKKSLLLGLYSDKQERLCGVGEWWVRSWYCSLTNRGTKKV